MKELEVGGPSVSLGQLGAAVQASCPHLPSALGPASSLFKPQMFAFLTTAERGTESWKLSILEKAGKQNDPRREAAISHTWPCLAWAPALPTVLISWRSPQAACLIKGDSDLIVSDYYWIPYKLLSESIVSHRLSSAAQLWKETLGLALIPSTKLIKVIWDKFLLSMRTIEVVIAH